MARETKPDWQKWRLIPEWHLWQALALSVDVEPSAARIKYDIDGLDTTDFRYARGELGRRAEIVYQIVDMGYGEAQGLLAVEWRRGRAPLAAPVRPANFVQWSKTAGWELPPELLACATECRGDDGQHLKATRWPWGDYETKLLSVLAEAVHQHWSVYESEKPGTAPLQAEVTEWIEQRLTEIGYQNPSTLAQYMATIIRADGAPVGRRKG